jgi:RecB family exonuclease
MWDPPLEHPLRRLFAGLAEHAFFSHLGVADPPLIDYLSALLARFVHTNDVYRLRGSAGRPLTELAEMVIAAERLPAGGKTRCDYYRHIGDFALFWTGVFPEAVERTRSRAGKDALVSYTAQGKRGYLITSRMEEERHHDAEAELFRRLSEQFEVCAEGLRKVRAELKELPPAPPGSGLIG